jgi:hypothetical protein
VRSATLAMAIAGAGRALNTASSLAVMMGAVYLVDCRISVKQQSEIERCYFTAFPIMGIGAAGKGGFSIGYQTYNPSLRREDTENGSSNSGT